MTARSSWSPRLCGSHHHAAPLDAPNALPAAPTAMCRATRCVTCASARTTTHGALCWSPIKLSRKRVGQCVHGRAGAKVLAQRYLPACIACTRRPTTRLAGAPADRPLRAKRSNQQGRHSSIYVNARVRVRTHGAFLPVCHRIRVYETCGANAPYVCQMV